jgi:hypothetical protein
MSKILGLALGCIPIAFGERGFHPNETTNLLTLLMGLCRYNEVEYLPSVIAEFIRTEMDLDPLHSQILILDALPTLVDVGTQFRRMAATGCLQRYVVHQHIILMEVDDDYQDHYAHSDAPPKY